jgi:HD-GYP domain-containing protein (c-di-GMP phosphodiesterase class II)
MLGEELGLPAKRLTGLELAGLVHDVGKIQVPAEILSKPGRLTDLERALVKQHPVVGARLLDGIEFEWPIQAIIRQHHERMDGSGYPEGLKGDDILLEARIIAVADTLEAMASHRPYRPAQGIEEAAAEIREGAGTRYDPEVAAACLKLIDEQRLPLV